jgi:NAD(P)-dependent dehydrogenase (short-subunit alcohol dehydrogenase family)
LHDRHDARIRKIEPGERRQSRNRGADGQPDELVGTLLLLCSQAGDWITGQVIHVDGGWVLRP